MSRIRAGAALALCAVVLFATAVQTRAESYRWDNVERVVVVPDVHGAYPAFVELLETTGIIDAAGRWSGGDAHLVSLGDLLDRGPESRRVMDLLIRLQAESETAGGRVHVVAGNHELMNLIGDLRYVAPEEFAAFSLDETDAMRADADSDQTYPPGYFAHRRAFRPDGYYGKWLLSLPAVVVINDTAYAHGGLPPLAASKSLDELNREYRATVRRYLTLWRELVDLGLLPDDESEDAGVLARSALADAEQSPCLEERVAECVNVQQTEQLQEFVEISSSPLLSDEGPLWYRGAVYCRALFERPMLESALAAVGARRVVAGHTTAPDATVHTLHDDRLMLLDTGMLVSYYKGRPAALVIDQQDEYVQYLSPSERAQPLRGRYPGSYGKSARWLLAALEAGEVDVLERSGAQQRWPVSVTYEGSTISADFVPQSQDGIADRELAAYRLDQHLGFDLVPAATRREVEGTPGTLQLVYQKALTERERVDAGRRVGGWCSLNRQLQMMYVWDLLTANAGRTVDNVLYQLPLWRLRVNAHADAFGLSRRLPRGLKERAIQLHPEVKLALEKLTREQLQEQLGELLDDKSIRALLKRRDALLKLLG